MAKKDGCSELLSGSVETIINNEDLMTEILLWLPAKSLIRFKCVSKDWCMLISSSRFINKQYARNRKLVSGIYFHPETLISRNPLQSLSLCGNLNHVDLSFIDETDRRSLFRVQGSCNSLTLLSRFVFTDFYVCNLITQKYNLLPKFDFHIKYPGEVCLAFDPSLSPYYKVVLFFTQTLESYPILIYSSENNSWKRVEVDANPGNYKVVFWDAAIHWMNEYNTLFRFLIDEERLIATKMPPKPKILKALNIRYFGECDGQLLLIQSRLRLAMRFSVLEMKKGTFCWNVKYRVNLEHVMQVRPTYKGRSFYVIGIVKESRESDLVIVLATPSKLLFYNLRQKTMDFVRDFSISYVYLCLCHMPSYLVYGDCFPFVESLFPVRYDI